MSNLTPDQLQELRLFFQRVAPKHNAAELTDSVAATVERWRQQEAAKRRDSERIKKALKQVDAALKQLEGVTTDEGRHLHNALLTARRETGDPTEKGREIQSTYIDVTGAEVETHDATIARTPSNETALIWELQGFWISRFKERPGKWESHAFFEMAAIALGKSENKTVFRQWERNSIGNKTSAK